MAMLRAGGSTVPALKQLRMTPGTSLELYKGQRASVSIKPQTKSSSQVPTKGKGKKGQEITGTGSHGKGKLISQRKEKLARLDQYQKNFMPNYQGGSVQAPKKVGSSRDNSKDVDLGISPESQFKRRPPPPNSLPQFTSKALKVAEPGDLLAWSQNFLKAVSRDNFGLPSNIEKHFRYQVQPTTVVRKSTLDMINLLERSRSEKVPNIVLYSPIRSGSSTLTLQAVSHALDNMWIVIYISSTVHITRNKSSYVYSEKHQVYVQDELARSFLKRILAVNENMLKHITIIDESAKLSNGSTIAKGANLSKAISDGLKSAQSVDDIQTLLEIVMKNIVQQSHVPVLFAMDTAQDLFARTDFRDPDFRELWPYELGLVRTLLACLRREGPGSFGGVQSGMSLMCIAPTIGYSNVSEEMRAVLPIRPATDAYARLDENLVQLIRDSKFDVMTMDNLPLTRNEASAVMLGMELEQKMFARPTAELLHCKIMASGGKIGEFIQSVENTALWSPKARHSRGALIPQAQTANLGMLHSQRADAAERQ